MLFLNISTDLVNIEIEKEKIKLDRNEIENTIWPILVKLHKKYKFKEVFLLNWPWGFTNLRVWTLAINLLNTLEKWSIDIYSISKIDFFTYFVQENILPNKWIIYIWQKKNVRLYDFINSKYTTIKKDEIDYNKNLFFDLVYEREYFDKQPLDIYTKNDNIILKYNKKEFNTNIKKLNLKSEKLVEAKYFIQPTMW